MTIQSPVMCQVDDCDRQAAASVRREDLPGPIQLCFTHTEDFRMNGAAWKVSWGSAESGPISVRAAPVAAVGRSPAASVESPAPGAAAWARLKSRLSRRRQA